MIPNPELEETLYLLLVLNPKDQRIIVAINSDRAFIEKKVAKKYPGFPHKIFPRHKLGDWYHPVIDWLRENNIPFPSSTTACILTSLIKGKSDNA